ncbi:hypothetical protein [Candidatus Cyanaurora vandensis]|uniref:hypothetical protein n=1 Tax=Candidatus Cyanaurora vandensis TaxID=2714958 RepID=UPI0025802DD6|nr:hypothetical protein [Candidatus Cyanaurora vandensis]
MDPAELTLGQVQECLESFATGQPVPQDLLSEVLRQTQFFLESDEISLPIKARLQRLELAVLDTYRPTQPEEARLLLTFTRQDREGVSVDVLVRVVQAVIELLTEVAKLRDLSFIPTYDLTALQAGGMSVEMRCLHLDYYQPQLGEPEEPQYLGLIERVGEVFQTLGMGQPTDKEALQHLLPPRARRALNQLVRLLRPEVSDLNTLELTIAQGNQRTPAAVLNQENRELFYFPEAPEWQEVRLVGILTRREQDLDERRNSVHIQGQDGILYICRRFSDRIYQDQLSQLPLGTQICLTGKIKYTYDDTQTPRRAECRVHQVTIPPLPEQQIPLWVGE